MSDWLPWLLMGVFAVHLVAFAMLWFRRRQGYYVALVFTFTFLTLSIGPRLTGVAPLVMGRPLDEWLRFAAWAAAAISISWTVVRVLRRTQEPRQNSS